jgi:trehalose 6-phosphate phosphatase
MAVKGAPPAVGPDIALFLDIDGTLLEHQPHPDGVFVDDALRNLLIAVEERLRGAVAFITGRSVAMVDRLFAPLSLPVAGLYGLEHRLRPGDPATIADEPADLAAIAEALQEEFRQTDGVYFERKGAVLAIHTRGAPHALDSVRAAAERVLPGLPGGYRIVAGNAGLEFLPVHALKGAAINRFMAIAPFAGRRPIFIGDDVSDESGFEYVNEIGGISIRVRPSGETAAGFILSDVAAVRNWIGSAVVADMMLRPSAA